MPKAAMKDHAGYLRHAFEPAEVIVTQFQEETQGVKFDTLVGVGISGALVVPVIARAIGCHFLIVRKKNDGSHSWRTVEGSLGERWLFVDDLVDSGSTRKHVVASVAQFAKRERHATVCVGQYMYDGAIGPFGFTAYGARSFPALRPAKPSQPRDSKGRFESVSF